MGCIVENMSKLFHLFGSQFHSQDNKKDGQGDPIKLIRSLKWHHFFELLLCELDSGIIVVPAFMNLYETSSIYLFIFYYFTHCLIRNLITLQYIICWDKTAAVYKILWIDSQHLFQFHSSIIEAGKLKITFSRFP